MSRARRRPSSADALLPRPALRPARRGGRWRDLDPTHLAVGEGVVRAQLEAERADVEVERAILVGGRNRHAPDLGEMLPVRHVRLLSVCGTLTSETAGGAENHRPSAERSELPLRHTVISTPATAIVG